MPEIEPELYRMSSDSSDFCPKMQKFILYVYVAVADNCQNESTENDAQTALDRK